MIELYRPPCGETEIDFGLNQEDFRRVYDEDGCHELVLVTDGIETSMIKQ